MIREDLLTCPGDLGEDLVGGLGPIKRRRVLVVRIQEVLDGLLEFPDAGVRTTLDLLGGQDAEPAFHVPFVP